MDLSRPNLQLTGETVIVNTPGACKVAQGIFRLENREAAPLPVAVNVAWVEFGNGWQLLLPDFAVYDLAQGLPLDPRRFTIGAQASLPIKIDFVQPAYEPDFGEWTAVGLRLEAGGVWLEALSSVEFVRRAG